MPTHTVLGLDLHRHPSVEEHAAWLNAQVDRTLILLRDAVAAADEPQRLGLAERLDHCRAVLAVDDEAGVARRLFDETLARCREIVGQMAREETERRRELASLVAVVHDAVSAVGVEMTTIHSSIGQSADRFAALTQMNDPRQMKARLIAEVTALKQAASERRRVWEATAKQFSQRVETLEQQLMTSRTEASLDALTGIANRRTFDRVCQEWIRSERSRFVLAVIDVDDFKGINDTHGHSTGDQVLTAIAQALLRSIRPGDLAARLGGDEFAILASDLTLRQAEARFGRTIQSLLVGPEVPELPCTPALSCGLAEFSAGDTFESLFERADGALYSAKRQGKNRVVANARAFIRDLMRR